MGKTKPRSNGSRPAAVPAESAASSSFSVGSELHRTDRRKLSTSLTPQTIDMVEKLQGVWGTASLSQAIERAVRTAYFSDEVQRLVRIVQGSQVEKEAGRS